MVGAGPHYALAHAGRSGHLQTVGEGDEVDYYFVFEGSVQVFRPDDPEVIGCADAGLK